VLPLLPALLLMKPCTAASAGGPLGLRLGFWPLLGPRPRAAPVWALAVAVRPHLCPYICLLSNPTWKEGPAGGRAFYSRCFAA